MIKVSIEGAKDSGAEYDEDAFNAADLRLREAVTNYYGTGARIDNVADCVKGGLEDAEAEA